MADISQINLPDGTTYNLKDSYARTNYVLKAGDTITGRVAYKNVSIPISAGKITNLAAGTTEIFKDGIAISNQATANDVGWIRVLGTGESDTIMEIATGDDGGAGEQIVVRQYNTSSTVVNEATLLDKSGNTTFPKNVTATKFIGALEGDADTWDGYHCYYDRYKSTYGFTQPTADTVWYVQISTANWNSNLEVIQIRTSGDNKTGSHVLYTGSRGSKWWGYGQVYSHRGLAGVKKSISNSDNIYLKFDADCTSCVIRTSFDARVAEIVTNVTDGYTEVPSVGGLYGNYATFTSIAGNITGSASSASTAGRLTLANYTSSTYTTHTSASQLRANLTTKKNCGIDNTSNGGVLIASNWTSNTYNSEIFMGMGDNPTLYYRGKNNGTYCAWQQIITAAGGTMTGQLILSATGLKTNNVAGYSIDQYGNITHLRNTSSDTLEIKNNAGSAKLKVAYESGDVTMTGTIITPADDSKGLKPASADYGQIGSASEWYYRMYADHYYAKDIYVTTSFATPTGTGATYIQLSTTDITSSDKWDGTNASLKTALGAVVTYKDFTCTSASVPANSSKEFASVNVAKTGYTPIGFLKYNTGDGSITPVNLYLEGNNAILVLRNVSSTAKSVAPTFRILYMKTTS